MRVALLVSALVAGAVGGCGTTTGAGLAAAPAASYPVSRPGGPPPFHVCAPTIVPGTSSASAPMPDLVGRSLQSAKATMTRLLGAAECITWHEPVLGSVTNEAASLVCDQSPQIGSVITGLTAVDVGVVKAGQQCPPPPSITAFFTTSGPGVFPGTSALPYLPPTYLPPPPAPAPTALPLSPPP